MNDDEKPLRAISLHAKLFSGHWTFVLLLCAITVFGAVMLYSVAGGRTDPWASRQLVRFAIGIGLLITVALVDIRLWMKAAYPLYGAALFMLLMVPVFGTTAGGAQRWINLGAFQLQPSEFMKIALVLALAAYYQRLSREAVSRPLHLLIPLALILVPTLLVVKQPDLGTAILLLAGGIGILLVAGVHWGYFAAGFVAILAAIPVAWKFLHGYQQQRILTFLNPERDPLGAGYHILQSKIAIGSGGIWGKGLLHGTQSQLNFLPEQHTDFIFTIFAEEMGFAGGIALLSAYLLVLGYGLFVAVNSFSQFGRLLATGVCLTFFLYAFVNLAMVMGLMPVVGVPLPLVSYGGTAMITLMLGFGLLMNVALHRRIEFTHHDMSLV